MRARAALLLIAAAGVVTGGCVTAAKPLTTALPSEVVTTMEGAAAPLGKIVEGRVVLVSLWATWCTGCEKELDALNRLHDRTAARADALVLGIAVGESRETVEAYTRRNGVRYVQVIDERFRLADALGQRDVPATLVVDRNGRIVYRGDALDADGLSAFRKALEASDREAPLANGAARSW